jgi:hypothetical protein
MAAPFPDRINGSAAAPHLPQQDCTNGCMERPLRRGLARSRIMISLIAGLLTVTLGAAAVVWGAAVRGAMEHDGTLRAVARRLPRGAAQEVS